MQSSREGQEDIRKPSSVNNKKKKKKEENNRMGKTRDLFKKTGDRKGNISCKYGHRKGQK